jgi:hypothetical protein
MLLLVLLAPAGLQALAMVLDEGICHKGRGLGRWERLGHPLDTLSVAACYAWLVAHAPGTPNALGVYVVLAAVSCLLITKDEFVHVKVCDARESWLHAVLFVLHPIVFLAFGMLWLSGQHAGFIRIQLAVTLAFAFYQFAYWSIWWSPRQNTLAT